jgi:hypothetical protein
MNMKTIKQWLLLAFLASAIVTNLTLSGCNEGEEGSNPCIEVECHNDGEKIKINDDTCECDCPEGYGGMFCEITLANCSGVECPEGEEPNPANDCLCE